MLDKEQRHCKICDFGLAVAAEGKKKHHVGDTKSTRGSPLWMAPERIVNKVIKEKELIDDLKHEMDSYKKLINVCITIILKSNIHFSGTNLVTLIILKKAMFIRLE